MKKKDFIEGKQSNYYIIRSSGEKGEKTRETPRSFMQDSPAMINKTVYTFGGKQNISECKDMKNFIFNTIKRKSVAPIIQNSTNKALQDFRYIQKRKFKKSGQNCLTKSFVGKEDDPRFNEAPYFIRLVFF